MSAQIRRFCANVRSTPMTSFIRRHALFFIGLLAILIYWLSVRPHGRGYIEDLCIFETSRQLMAESLAQFGKPTFTTDAHGGPAGISVAFMPWSLELNWIGGWFWNWDRDFPFFWMWLGLSLCASYLGSGYFMRKLGLSRNVAWGLALLVTVFHAPRHFKAWHHYEHLIQHWITLALFLDAWIWQRFWRERKVSASLEAWRAFFMIGMLNTAGYYWGVMILQWLIQRLSMLVITWRRSKRQEPATEIIRDWRGTLVPIALGSAMLSIQLQWLLPLKAEADKLGWVYQPMGWFSSIFTVMRPLWLEPTFGNFLKLFPGFPIPLIPLTYYETLTAIGWVFWVPAILGIRALKRRHGGPGVATVLPFLILLCIGIEWVSIRPHWMQEFFRATIPFLSYFRAGSRWGLIFPQLVTILIALSWPELSAWFRARWADRAHHPRFRAAFAAFAVLCLLETHVLLRKPELLPALDAPMLSLLEDVRNRPGTRVLDMPFCLAGGNEICTFEKCREYPGATAGACFRGWHDKKVFGIYESRLVQSQCQVFDAPPYASWFSAWNGKRCFSPPEWQEFCSFLDQHPDIDSVLVYPDLWMNVDAPECQAQFNAHLGPKRGEASFSTARNPGGLPLRPSRVWHFAGKCNKNR
jgi:hypothetical protein